MTDRDALLREILDRPDDDTARLAYADLLDELGGKRNAARAEFIRVQIAEHGVPSFGGGLSRSAALLKTWCAAWLPKSLRPGYPGLAVSGNVVACDPLGGYVRFERGFVAHAGCELPWRPDEVGPAAQRFGERLRALVACNPLSGFTVSFEGSDHPALTAAVGSQATGGGREWIVGWDWDTQSLLRHHVAPRVRDGRDELGRVIGVWLVDAVRDSALAVAATRVLEDALGVDVGPDFVSPEDAEMIGDDGDRGYGSTYW